MLCLCLASNTLLASSLPYHMSVPYELLNIRESSAPFETTTGDNPIPSANYELSEPFFSVCPSLHTALNGIPLRVRSLSTGRSCLPKVAIPPSPGWQYYWSPRTGKPHTHLGCPARPLLRLSLSRHLSSPRSPNLAFLVACSARHHIG